MSFDLEIKNGNLVIENGDIKKIENSNKLKQDILKICLTPVGSDQLNPWYGSYFAKTAIGSSENELMTKTVAQSQILKSLENLKELQINQIKNGQYLSASEQILSVQSVQIDRDKFDPRIYHVYINIISKGYTNVNVNFEVSTI